MFSMKKIIAPTIFLLFFCVGCIHGFAQGKQEFLDVNYASIEKFVTQQEAQYDSLMQRFIEGDTTLTSDEVKYVFYGSYFSLKYAYTNPSHELMDAFKEKRYEDVLNLGQKELTKSPAQLAILFRMCVAALEQEEEEKAQLYRTRLLQVLDVILSSGDWKSAQTAYKVLEVSDEYVILYGVFGVHLTQQALSGKCDIMTVYEDENPDETVDIYFDVSLHMATLNNLFGTPSHQKAKKKGRKK